MDQMIVGKIDVHSHLLPGVDDGCADVVESLACARKMVAAGYTHSFCTPHYWPNLNNTSGTTPGKVVELQLALDAAGIALKLYSGGEINIEPGLAGNDPADMVSYGMNRRFALVDIWAEKLPSHFYRNIKWLQSLGMTVILAHPERMRAVQDNPDIADDLSALGLLLQGNLQCLSDPPDSMTRITVERYLREDRYFMLGSDLHNIRTLDHRLNGLDQAQRLVGKSKLEQLTVEHPLQILEGSGLKR